MKLLRYGAVLLLCSVLGMAPVHAQDISVSLPDLTGLSSGSSLTIPVNVEEDVTGEGISAYEVTIQYDASILDITGATNDGTLTDSWGAPTVNTNVSGEVTISSATTTAIDGGPGALVILQADIVGSGSTALTFTDFRFNEGTPSASTTDGNASVDNLLVITEVHADPASGIEGDANGDGVRDSGDDEFVEIVNTGGDSVDLSGYTIADTNSDRFTFPAGAALAPGVSATVFGGGTPTGIPGEVFTASSLGLNNGGDTVTLKDASGNRVDAVTYGGEGGNDQSLTRNPDFFDPFVLHTTTSSGLRYSPGQSPDGGALPVELTRFDAVVKGGDVTLRWATASETNNSGFEVQQRVDGAYQQLGFVEGAGTTSRAQSYQYEVDGLEAGTHVFRLKQVDFDGSAEYSQQVEVQISVDGRFEMEAAYPNPFRGAATVALRVKKTQDVSVGLYNMLGQRVRDLYRGTMHSGQKRTFTIDGSGLSSGMYIYRVQGETFSEARQITHVE